MKKYFVILLFSFFALFVKAQSGETSTNNTLLNKGLKLNFEYAKGMSLEGTNLPYSYQSGLLSIGFRFNDMYMLSIKSGINVLTSKVELFNIYPVVSAYTSPIFSERSNQSIKTLNSTPIYISYDQTLTHGKVSSCLSISMGYNYYHKNSLLFDYTYEYPFQYINVVEKIKINNGLLINPEWKFLHKLYKRINLNYALGYHKEINTYNKSADIIITTNQVYVHKRENTNSFSLGFFYLKTGIGF